MRAAWCMPWSINTTETAKGIVSEQWVYEDPPYTIGYLYFENGKLIAIQRHRLILLARTAFLRWRASHEFE